MQTTRHRPNGSRTAPRRSPITGSGAASRKYDLLTAVAAWGLAGGPGQRATALRLIAMVTARYDWSADSVSIGQAELARLWGVSLRTAKREMARMSASGLLVCIAPGVRGRVGVYRLDPGGLRRLTEPAWPHVGDEFAARMDAALGGAEHGLRVVEPAPAEPAEPDPEGRADGAWAALHRSLRTGSPAAHAAWYAHLAFGGRQGERVRIVAPSRFVASYIETHLALPLSQAVERAYGPGCRVVLEVGRA